MIFEPADLDTHQLRDIARLAGPCLTFMVPGYRPGSQDGPQQSVLRDLLEEARHALALGSHEADAPGLLRPVEEILAMPELKLGGAGFVIFRSADASRVFRAEQIRKAQVVVSSHARITPFLESAFSPQVFYVLGLSQKKLRLVSYDHGKCEELAIPDGIPKGPSEAFDFDTAQHGLNRASKVGQSHGAAFGTDTEREKLQKHLHEFFKILDRGLAPVVEGHPVLLAGTKSEITEFRKCTTHLNLLRPEITGSIEHWRLQELADSARAAAVEHYLSQGSEAMDRYEAVAIGDRKLSDPLEIIEAADAGRVHQLCVRQNATQPGRLPIPFNTAHVGDEDLVNAACVITLAKGGDVSVVPADRMDAKTPLGAALRY